MSARNSEHLISPVPTPTVVAPTTRETGNPGLRRSAPHPCGSNIGHDQVRDLLQRRKQENTAPVVVVDHEAVCPQPETLLDLGALDVISGLDDHPRLAEIVDRVSKSQTGNDEVDRSFFAEDCPSCVSIVGRSPATEKALRMIRLVASSSCNPVLIVGETGTGKELAARAVHILRHGADKKFVAVNCAALTANLLESELFGHVKGSFTSAEREKTGLLEVAGSGSIFLDEISEMPLDLQAKLLRVLQEKTFRKVGGIKDIACKATIIASSNRNLMQEVENGRFRRDLYRLSICPFIWRRSATNHAATTSSSWPNTSFETVKSAPRRKAR